ncbi:MAG: hypothetical protein IKH54_07365 [Bacilli bacterium]|nr:hypothetical protein [Bacilli bacterium]
MNKKFILASIDIILFMILSIVLDFFIYKVYYSDLLIGVIIGQFILLLISLFTYFNKKTIIYNIGIFLTFMINIISVFYIYNIDNKYDLFEGIIYNKYEYKEYTLYSKKNTTYNEMSKLSGKKVGVMVNNYDNACNVLKDNIDVECILYYSMEDMFEALKMGEIQGFFIDEFDDSMDIIESNYKYLSSFKVKCIK